MNGTTGLALRMGIIQMVPALFRQPFFEALAEHTGWRVDVLAGQCPEHDRIKTFASLEKAHFSDTHNIYLRRPYLCWQQNVGEWLDRVDPETVVIPATPRILSSLIALGWCSRRGRSVIAWGMGSMPGISRKRLGLQSRFVRQLISRVDGVICYSSAAERYYASLGIPWERIHVAHNSVDTSESERLLRKLKPDMSWIHDWRRVYGLEQGVPVAVFVGRLTPSKKVDELIRALDPHAGRCQLLIVGEGVDEGRLKRIAAASRVRVSFAGFQSGVTLAQCFLGSDFFVLPFLGGLAIQQAMSYGKPVLVSVGDGTEEDLVHHGINGMVFRQNDYQDLSEKIGELLDCPGRLEAMGAESLRIVREEININTMVHSFSRAVRSLSGRRSG